MNKIIIFGGGYVGSNFAKIIQEKFTIISTHQDKEVIFNSSTKLNIDLFDKTTHILITIPPQEDGDLAFINHVEDIKEIKTLKWIGYISSTGVYGNHSGRWVSESSDLLAEDPTNLRRIKAEKQWLEAFPDHAHIFRLSGIYGPGRSLIDKVKEGTARRICKKGHYFSRIHIDDICALIEKSIAHPTPGEIYNLADDLPAEPSSVVEYYCDKLQLPYPPLEQFETAELSSLMQSFYLNNKKTSNRKIKELFSYQLIHPSYKN